MSNQMQPSASSGKGSGLGIASLVLGILSLCGSGILLCGGILSLVGIILGVLGINSKGKSMAIAGIVLSVVGLLAGIVIRVFFRGMMGNIMPNIIQQYLNGRGY